MGPPSPRASVTLPEGAFFAPILPELLAEPGITIAHIKVWSHVWLQTLGRPDWTRSHRQIAEATGLGKNTVRRAVELLAAAGWLTVEHRRGERGHAASLMRCAFPEGVCPAVGIGMPADGHRGGGLDGHTSKSHSRKKKNTPSPAGEAAIDPSADAAEWADWLETEDPELWDAAYTEACRQLPADVVEAYCDPDTDRRTFDRLHERFCVDALAAYGRLIGLEAAA